MTTETLKQSIGIPTPSVLPRHFPASRRKGARSGHTTITYIRAGNITSILHVYVSIFSLLSLVLSMLLFFPYILQAYSSVKLLCSSCPYILQAYSSVKFLCQISQTHSQTKHAKHTPHKLRANANDKTREP